MSLFVFLQFSPRILPRRLHSPKGSMKKPEESWEFRTIRHTSGAFQIGLLENSWKLSFNISHYNTNKELAAVGYFGILPLRVLALMRLNRCVPVGTHGGVRGQLFI